MNVLSFTYTKFRLLLFLLILITQIFSINGQEDSRVLKVGVVTLFPPQYSISASGKPQGLAIDIIESLVGNTEFSIEYIIKENWTELFTALETGEIDLIPNQGITESRTKLFSFSNTLETFPIKIFTRESYEEVNGINDLNYKTIAVVKKNIGEVLARDAIEPDIKVFDECENALFDLLSGNSDALIYPEPVVLSIARKALVEDLIKTNGPALKEVKRGISVLKGNEWILETFNPIITEFIKTNEYREIYVKWYGEPIPYWNVKRVIVLMSIIIIFLVFGMLVWKNYSTQNLVKKKTLELRSAEWKFKALFENGPIGVAYHQMIYNGTGDPIDYFFIDANKKYIDLTGVDPRNQLATEAFPGIENDLAFDWIGTFGKVAKSGNPIRFETNLSANNRWYDCVGYQYKPDHFVAAFLEITERKLFEYELFTEKERLSVTLGSIADGVITTDVNGNVIMLNKVAEELTGWSNDSSKNLTLDVIFNIINTKSRVKFNNLVEDVIKLDSLSELETPISLISKDGKIYNISIRASSILDKNNVFVGTVIIFSDISEKLRLQEQVLHDNKMEAIGQLTGGVAHDFNNTLSGIMGAAELLHKMGDDQPKTKKYIDMILNSAGRAAELTKKLLLFSRKGDQIISTIDVLRIINDTIALLKHTFDKNIKISIDNRSTNTKILGNESMLQNSFMNLAINSSHAIEDGGEITFKLENVILDESYCNASSFNLIPGEYLKVDVKDSGYGMNTATLSHVFEPFFTTKDQSEGTGLGLSTVYGTIQDHNGAITVHSEVGSGTIFNLFFPVTESECLKSVGDEIVSGAGKILVIDDEEIIRETIKIMLESIGYDVLCAENGKVGLQLFFQNSIDLIILDMIMPVMNGRNTLSELRKRDEGIPVVISSGYAEDEDLSILKELGISGFLNKPFYQNELAQIVSKVLNKSS